MTDRLKRLLLTKSAQRLLRSPDYEAIAPVIAKLITECFWVLQVTSSHLLVLEAAIDVNKLPVFHSSSELILLRFIEVDNFEVLLDRVSHLSPHFLARCDLTSNLVSNLL